MDHDQTWNQHAGEPVTMPHPKDIFKRTELQSPNRSSNSVGHVGFSHRSVPHILVHLKREFPYLLHSIKPVSKKVLLAQCWIDADLNNIACCCRQQPSLAQWQTRSSGGDKVGFEWLEGPNVIDFELFIHAWCHHIAAKMGEQDSRLHHVGQRGVLTTGTVHQLVSSYCRAAQD